MYLSDLTEESVRALTPAQMWNIVCGGIADDGKSADVGLLLGGRPIRSTHRAHEAAQLYLQGRVKYLVPCGGVEWEANGETKSEAIYMRDILLADGVPEEGIILENESRTTKENMICGTLQINRATHFEGRRIMIVSSKNHIKRSVALAKVFMPRIAEISYFPCSPDSTYEEFMKDPDFLERELGLLLRFVREKIIPDFPIDPDHGAF